MTLLELLRQELPKRGGWPEGADYVAQDGDGSNDVKFGAGEPSVQYDCDRVWRNTELSDWGIDTSESYIRDITVLADDHSTAIVTREQYEVTSCNFRPLRTEAERAIDEMVRLSGVSIGAAKILYDAGYRKG